MCKNSTVQQNVHLIASNKIQKKTHNEDLRNMHIKHYECGYNKGVRWAEYRLTRGMAGIRKEYII